ncbi:glycosyltransferase [Lacticaseibacillus hulanensis]|uniref:glycosyltransferase n=1 Tax=Lacticaseibacillus hulanensis TaxID=2493111 RepID=UPI000FD7D613|nr:glycosyltransferase [Lacticaseibacillus hulanensis]
MTHSTLVVLPYLSGHGGTETVINEWQNYFRTNNDQEILFVAPTGAKDKQWLSNQNNVIFNDTFKNKFLREVSGIMFLLFVIRKIKPANVIVLSTKLLDIVTFFRKWTRIKFKVTTWLHFSLYKGTGFNLKNIKYADYHLCISSGIKKELLSLGISSEKIFVIGNPLKRTNQLIEDSKDIVTFLYVGRVMLDGQKNLRDLFTALNDVTGKWRLDIIGDAPTVELKKVKDYVNKTPYSERVNFFGWKLDPWREVSNISAVVLTSKYEGFGMSLAEGCARGVPCISADCPVGPSDIVKDGKNGYLYNPSDLSRLVKILQMFVDRKVVFDRNYVKQTVNEYYLPKYFSRLTTILDRINLENE